MHPGEYTVEASCFLRSAYEVWPDKGRVANATTISLVNGQERTGIDFDLSDRWDESAGANHVLNFATADERNTPRCVEAYAPNGTLVRRHFGFSVSTPDNGEYRLRLTDCFGLGFANQWFPAGASLTSGPTITVDGSSGEIYHYPAPLSG